MNKGLVIGMLLAFISLSFMAFFQAMPQSKNQEVMRKLKPYIPFKLEKRAAGLTIIDTRDGSKEEPDNMVVYKRLDELEQKWGKNHLEIQNGKLIVKDKDGKNIKEFKLSKEELSFAKSFFGI
jgi:tetrahydromethanopterin S-methyltransferase subunit G